MKLFMITLLYTLTYVPVLAFLAMTPYLTRKTESFGISIPENVYGHPEIVRIRKTYRNKVFALGGLLAVFAVLFILFTSNNDATLFMPIGLVGTIVGSFLLYLEGHTKMKALKAVDKPQAVVVDTDFHSKKIAVNPAWFLLYAFVILATLCLGVMFYDKMPLRVPMHIDINGVVDRYADKSYKLIFITPMIQLFLTMLFIFVNYIITIAKQQIDAANPEKSIEQNIRFRLIWSRFLVFMGFLTVASMSFMQCMFVGLITDPWINAGIPIVVGGITSVMAIIISFKTGQGGSRLAAAVGKSGDVVNRDDDKCWKLGVFYYNPDDPALFVEKRFGIGWTNNFAQPVSWILLAAIAIVLPILITLVTNALSS